ncbi:MaoC/PaaZ C-terminal domain-containing protein [Streptomyces sp. UNOC14_S4]|uniref:MaoC/PaaZ C-terminal domain-containing protein n=1 Tax=Streptomyces sp. UNOC14_S4 TaxID=2872340 RepID=UPI001E37D4E6|nr:MaoC/PaaZ C-terminal domain-containing protein [Streptomyces sp. UNOC14_S4]MCC3766847.1 acyl dehydratase [Streptomyces sp. UNOC14_S4]
MRVGDELPPLTVPVTRTLVVAGALVSRDFQDVHHDAEAARAKGSPDVFMNILTTNGLVGRFVTDHFGPEARLRKVSIRLGVPNYPGDSLVLSGRIVSVRDRTPAQTSVEVVEVSVVGTNRLGHHVTGTVTVTLPSLPSLPSQSSLSSSSSQSPSPARAPA